MATAPIPGTTTPSSAAAPSADRLRAAIALLEGSTPTADERLALSEAYFRLAMQPDLDVDEQIELLRSAERLDPYHPKLPFHLGRLRHLNGDVLGAVFEYRRALRLAPRSHRTFVHLALALRQLTGNERSLSVDIIAALGEGNDQQLREATAKLDAAIETHVNLGKKTGESKKADAAPTVEQAASSGPSRWRGLWKLSLLDELAKPQAQRKKQSEKKVDKLLAEGRTLIDAGRGVSEYALACLLLMIEGPGACRRVKALLREPAFSTHADRIAVRLLAAASDLGEAKNAEQFVEIAAAKVQASELPVELVCCLHYAWYGESGHTDALKSVEILGAYPEQIRAAAAFKELRVAILDRHAREEFEERPDRAEILWRETTDADPFRIAVAHNLALAATRTKSRGQYELAWERATELRYLLAAAAGDVRVELDDRARLHRSFAQQCKQRYSETTATKEGPDHTAIDVAGWMADTDALTTWLREWELYYLNSRLRFHSIVHLLGVGRDCSDEDAEAARDRLLLQFELSCRLRRWAGVRVFLDLVRHLAARACDDAKDLIVRKRDPYYEFEKPESDLLAKEAVDHCVLLLTMLNTATRSDTPALRAAAYQVGRALMMMPLRALAPIFQKYISGGDVVEVLLSHFLALVYTEIKAPGALHHADAKLAALHDCLRALPESGELRVCFCRLALKAQRYREAYDAAQDGLPRTEQMSDRKAAGELVEQLTICLDNAAFGQIPEKLLRPSTKEEVTVLIAAGRRILADFPRAGGLRKLLAEYLIELGTVEADRLREAAVLLEEGLQTVISDEQLEEFKRLLEKAGSRSKSVEAVGRIRSLLESAAARARQAVALVREERTPATLQQARDLLDEAIHDCGQAETIATEAGLGAWADRSRRDAGELRQLHDEFDMG